MYACVYLTVRVEDMMKRSFAELDSARHEVDRQQALKDLEQSIGSLEDLDCPLCSTDVDHYYSACARIAHLRKEMQVEPLLYVIDIVTEWCFDGSSFCNDGCSWSQYRCSSDRWLPTPNQGTPAMTIPSQTAL